MKRPFGNALLCAAAFFTQFAAHAGELTLFTHDDFRGPSVTLRESTRDLVPLRFNDTASSLIVRSGRWEVCVDADFRGGCKVFEAGEYRSLPGMNDQISSAREVGGGGGWAGGGRPERDNPGRGNPGRGGPVTLFSDDGLRGRPLVLNGDASDFVPLGFNDQAVSLLIEEGSWQFCSDRDFRGQCRVYGPGQYRRLEPALMRSISSARRVDGQQGQGPDYGGNRPGRGEAAVELFGAADFRGAHLPLRRDARTLDSIDFNDRVGSIVINEGEWEFCVHADFGGHCEVFGPGRYPRLGPMDRQISSVRRVR